MMNNLVLETDPILRIKAELFDFSADNIDPDELSKSMLQFMIDSGGIGLAAPQIGLSLNVFVMGYAEKRWACFNPKIVSQSVNKVKIVEGCLSFPKLYLSIKRPETIVVQYQNEKGDIIEEKLEGMAGRCFQHELDHVQGIVFTTRAGPTTLALGKLRRKTLLRRNKV